MSRLDLVVGSNGAGKTTFVRLVLAPARPGVPFVNADEIAARRWPDDPAGHAYQAAEAAAATRAALLARGESFIAETVFSHPSKVDLVRDAAAARYDVRMHALLVPAELAVARVAYRVGAGGHAVPADKVRCRWQRLWPLVADAATLAGVAAFWDNSGHDGPELVGTFYSGVAASEVVWPSWAHPGLPARLGGIIAAG